MNKYAELRQRQQEEVNALPIGFASGQRQFEEMMKDWNLDPKNDTDKIYSIGHGEYIQTKDMKLLDQTAVRHDAEMEAAIAEDATGDGFIYEMFLCELDNNEFGYTINIDETLDSLSYTLEGVNSDKRLLHGLKKACTEILGRK